MSMNLVDKVIKIANAAGAAVLKIYQEEVCLVETKSDSSPLTAADTSSHNIIVSGLLELTPDIPIVSEEGAALSWAQRRNLSEYWLVDPLDGTKEFIARNGEFTVNIAYIKDNRSILGVVYAPVKNVLYFGSEEGGAFKSVNGATPVRIHVSDIPQDHELWRIVGSRSHRNDEFQSFVKKFPLFEVAAVGSSLKMCLVAEGVADLYPRLSPTSEWDTAASQAILESAGGSVINKDTMRPLKYNTKESMLNPKFIACAGKAAIWANEKITSEDIVWHDMPVDKQSRAKEMKQKPVIIWFTGLSGSGKSTSASALEQKLVALGYKTYLLDGDNVRHGLCSDLGFSDRDRSENIRRVGEVASLMIDAGLIVLASFISPFKRERNIVRRMVNVGEFIEVHINTPIATCENRDAKGLYKKARSGQLKNFTGIDSPYEIPESPEISIDTSSMTVDQVTDYLISRLSDKGVVQVFGCTSA